MKKRKDQNKKSKIRFFVFSKKSIGLAIILYLPFIYQFIITPSSKTDFLLYLYFPIAIISVVLAIGFSRIGLPILYEKFSLPICNNVYQKCIEGSGESFTGLWYPFISIMAAIYVYLLSCLILYIYKQLRRKK